MAFHRYFIGLMAAAVISSASASSFTETDKALRAGDYPAAISALKLVPTESREDLYGVMLRQAEIALGMGKAAFAEDLFEQASFQMPTATEAQAGLVRALMAQGRFKEAQTQARHALKEAPGDVMLTVTVAQLENRMGQAEAALNRLDKAIASLGQEDLAGMSALLIAQADILLQRGRNLQVKQTLTPWVARHPDDAAALDVLGQAEYAQGHHQEGRRLRAMAASRYYTQGEIAKAQTIREWMEAMSLYHPLSPAPAPVAAKTPEKPAIAKPEQANVDSAPPTPPRQYRAEVEPPVQPSPPVAAKKPAPRVLPDANFEPIHVPKGATILTGSGFIIDAGERVVTNAHVVGDAKQVTVRNGIGQVRKARVELINKEDDLAVLRLESAYPANWAIPRERIEEPRPGRSCYVLGYPLAGTLGTTWPALTSGLVSRTDGSEEGHMQITAALNSGNSGGPVVDDHGRLIGIVVSKLDVLKYAKKHGTLPEDVNFAIRPSLLMRVLSGLHQKVVDTQEAPGKMDAESIYELMLPSVVLVVAAVS